MGRCPTFKIFDVVKEREKYMYALVDFGLGYDTPWHDSNPAIKIGSGYGGRAELRFLGGTYPVDFKGMDGETFVPDIPPGLNAVAFYQEVLRSRELINLPADLWKLDAVCLREIGILLSYWRDDGKLIVKLSSEMRRAELNRFRPFHHTSGEIIVVENERRVAYTTRVIYQSERMPSPAGWTCREVTVTSILEYITKRKTLAQLEASAR